MEFTEKVKTGDKKLDFSLQATTDLHFYILEWKGTTRSFGLIYITRAIKFILVISALSP